MKCMEQFKVDCTKPCVETEISATARICIKGRQGFVTGRCAAEHIVCTDKSSVVLAHFCVHVSHWSDVPLQTGITNQMSRTIRFSNRISSSSRFVQNDSNDDEDQEGPRASCCSCYSDI
nr:hypothetical protein BaRGS_004829 [Batillaria attramentaria]